MCRAAWPDPPFAVTIFGRSLIECWLGSNCAMRLGQRVLIGELLLLLLHFKRLLLHFLFRGRGLLLQLRGARILLRRVLRDGRDLHRVLRNVWSCDGSHDLEPSHHHARALPGAGDRARIAGSLAENSLRPRRRGIVLLLRDFLAGGEIDVRGVAGDAQIRLGELSGRTDAEVRALQCSVGVRLIGLEGVVVSLLVCALGEILAVLLKRDAGVPRLQCSVRGRVLVERLRALLQLELIARSLLRLVRVWGPGSRHH